MVKRLAAAQIDLHVSESPQTGVGSVRGSHALEPAVFSVTLNVWAA